MRFIFIAKEENTIIKNNNTKIHIRTQAYHPVFPSLSIVPSLSYEIQSPMQHYVPTKYFKAVDVSMSRFKN